jgi:hypothetical protein
VGRWSRHLALLVAVVAALLAAGAASGRSSGIVVHGLSKPVYPGQTVQLRVVVRPGSVHCVASIRYTGGKLQRLGDRVAGPSGATWSFRIPAVPAGTARAGVDCGELGRTSISFRVQAALQAPRIIVERTGFSQRMNPKTNSSDVSFGLQLRNDRSKLDAGNLAILVNLVDPENRVLATDHLRLGRIPAGMTIYTGDQISHMVMLPVARVEVVAVQAISMPMQPATAPLISDIVIAPDRDGFIQTVYGQLLNQSELALQGGELGTVLVDAAGNIIGGGRGIIQGPVSLGARELFKTSSRLTAIPSVGTQALISVVPRYPRQT